MNAHRLTVTLRLADFILSIGFETAKALFARPEPYHVLVGCRGQISRAQDAIQELKKLSPRSTSTAQPLLVDISSDESITIAFTEVQEEFGYIDVLVNNAGTSAVLSSSPGPDLSLLQAPIWTLESPLAA